MIYAVINIGCFLYASQTRIFFLIMEEPEFRCDIPKGFNTTFDQCEYLDSQTNSTAKCSTFSYNMEKHIYLTSEVRFQNHPYSIVHTLSNFSLILCVIKLITENTVCHFTCWDRCCSTLS